MISIMCVRWSVASSLSDRPVEAPMQGPRVSVDHAAINRWVRQDSPLLEAAFCRCNYLVSIRWRMNETSMKVTEQ
jgi:putative transposase